MIEIKLDGFTRRPPALFSWEATATGVVVRLHGPLADALEVAAECAEAPQKVATAVAGHDPRQADLIEYLEGTGEFVVSEAAA